MAPQLDCAFLRFVPAVKGRFRKETHSVNVRLPLPPASDIRLSSDDGRERASEEGDGGSTDQSSPPSLSPSCVFLLAYSHPSYRRTDRRAARELIQICSGHELVFRISPSPPAPFASLPVFARNGSIDPARRAMKEPTGRMTHALITALLSLSRGGPTPNEAGDPSCLLRVDRGVFAYLQGGKRE